MNAMPGLLFLGAVSIALSYLFIKFVSLAKYKLNQHINRKGLNGKFKKCGVVKRISGTENVKVQRNIETLLNKDQVEMLKTFYGDILGKTIHYKKEPPPKRYTLIDGAEWFDHYGTHYDCDGEIKALDKVCKKCGAKLEWREW